MENLIERLNLSTSQPHADAEVVQVHDSRETFEIVESYLKRNEIQATRDEVFALVDVIEDFGSADIEPANKWFWID
jgi:hypothetical protein